MTRPVPAPARVTEVPALPPRAATAHKGDVGHVAVVAGSRGMGGAAVLCGLGALRAGAGLVRVHTARSVVAQVAAFEPSLMTTGIDEDAVGCANGNLLAAVDVAWAHVIAVGPGLGRSAELERNLAELVDRFSGKVVIDADGLNNLCGLKRETWLQHHAAETIITPHPGEMRRLRRGLGLPEAPMETDAERLAAATEFAYLTNTTVVLKGHRTVVSSPTLYYVNESGNPGMATGGMGDVLTGVIGALLAQGLGAFDAAVLAVHVHGLAGDRLAREVAPTGFLARELADAIPQALAEACRPRFGFR